MVFNSVLIEGVKARKIQHTTHSNISSSDSIQKGLLAWLLLRFI
jgi:hypothetical protein